MRIKKITITIQILLILFFITLPVLDVIHRSVSLISLLSYLAGILCTSRLFYSGHSRPNIPAKDVTGIGILSLIATLTLLYFASIPTHYHQDEFITAYTSWILPELLKINWFSAYPEIWVSQFPLLFHILQKPWFLLFGPSVFTIRLSVIPYVIGILISLFVVSTILRNRIFALTTGLLFVFFTPHLYLESTGLHFVSSSFFFIATLVSWIQFLRTENSTFAVLSGFFGACGFLTYTSSYMALPVIFLSALITWLTVHKQIIIRGFLKWIGMWAVVIAPFLAYAFFINNFFLQRISQVNIFSGTWSDAARTHTPIVQRILTQTVTAFRSLVLPHIGGIGGYHFGGMALLDIFSAILILIGVVAGIREALIKRNVIHQTLLVALLLPFLFGLVLTTHPPPFHRISLLYPLMAMYAGFGVWSIFEKIKKESVRNIILILFVTVYVAIQWTRTQTMIQQDATLYPQNSRVIASYLMQHVPAGGIIYIAAYPSFYLPQELLFRTKNTFVLVNDTTEKTIPKYDGNNPIILLNPSEEIKKQLLERYPYGQFIQTLDNTNLGDLTIFEPNK